MYLSSSFNQFDNIFKVPRSTHEPEINLIIGGAEGGLYETNLHGREITYFCERTQAKDLQRRY